MRHWTIPLSSILLLATVSLPAQAGFDEDVAKAYAPYRVALFKSNQKDQQGTKAAVTKFLEIWDGTILPSYQAVPPRYQAEISWPQTLHDIRAIAAKARTSVDKGDVAEAHEILEAIRDELDAMRDRNGIRVFSSFVNAYHTEMEHLFGIEVTKKSWSSQLAGEIREQTGILKYLSGEIASHAPVDLEGNGEFKALLKGLRQSVSSLTRALDAEDPAAVAKAIKMLKPAYAKLFLKFG